MSTWTRDDRPDFSGVDWRAMYEVASREREEAEQALRDYISAEAMGPNPYPLNAAPAVTRSEVEETLQAATNAPAGWTLHSLTDAVCRLIGIADDPVLSRAREYAEAVGIDWKNAEPEDVDLLMKVAEHVLGQEADQ